MKKVIFMLLMLSVGLFAQERKLGVAVNEFVPKNGVSRGEAETLRDIFQAELVNTGAYRVLERNKIDEILKEQEFQVSGCTESECAVEIGKLLNVELMFIGQLMRLGSSYKVIVSAVNVETGQIIASPNEKFSSMDIADAKVEIIAKRLAFGSVKKITGIENVELGKVENVSFDSDVSALEGGKLQLEAVEVLSSGSDIEKKIAQKFKQDLEKGDAYFQEKNYSSAKSEYEAIIEKYDDNLTQAFKESLKSYKTAAQSRLGELVNQRINHALSQGDEKLKSDADAAMRYYINAKKLLGSVPKDYEHKVSGRGKLIKERISTAHKKKIENLLKEGDAAFNGGSYQSALSHYQDAMSYYNEWSGKILGGSQIESSLRSKIIVAYQGRVIQLNKKANELYGSSMFVEAEAGFNAAVEKSKECEYFNEVEAKSARSRSDFEKAFWRAYETAVNGKETAYESQVVTFRNRIKSYSEKISLSAVFDEKDKAKRLLNDAVEIFSASKFSDDEEALGHLKEAHDILGLELDRFPGRIKKYTVNGVTFAVRWCPPGTFMMGSPSSERGRDSDETRREVRLKGFWMMETEVTQELYEAVMGKNPSHHKGAKRPVDSVSPGEARAFAKEISKITGKDFYVPLERYWEYAARAGTTTAYYWGDNPDGDYFWYKGNSGGKTHSVAGKKPNAWGLYDMSGNVWEWCGGGIRRGGSYYNSSSSGRSANRYASSKSSASVGLRLMQMDNANIEFSGGWRAGERKEYTVNGVDFAVRWCPAGTFTMGSPSSESGRFDDEGPQHKVTLTEGFWMMETEVTTELYAAYLKDGGDSSGVDWSDSDCPISRSGSSYNLSGNKFGTSWQQPMVEVSWHGAVSFSDWLSRKTGLNFRLPTEAQWEYAARAGTRTAYYWGSSMYGAYAWYDDNSGSKTHPVGRKRANAWGLYDMSGNVWEWCSDWYGDYSSSPSVDPTGPSSGAERVIRGGSWYYYAQGCRSAFRGDSYPDSASDAYGFRLLAAE